MTSPEPADSARGRIDTESVADGYGEGQRTTSPFGVTCRYIKEDGTRCQQKVGLSPEGYCIWHDPERQEEAQRRRQRGGEVAGALAKVRGRSRRTVRVVPESEALPPPETMEDALKWASWATWAVTVGKIDARTCHEIGYTLRAFLDGKKRADDWDRRVKELQAKIGELQKAGKR
jgi:hypothetical protein